MNFLKGFDAYLNANKYSLDNALLEALKISEIRPYIKAWEEAGGRERYAEWFGNKWRIYLDIAGDKSDTHKQVEDVLDENGYYIEDYFKNIARKTDDPRSEYKIGRLLNRFDKDLQVLYANDKDVIKADDTYMVVISRHPYDVVGMTTDRRWSGSSCMNSRTGGNRSYLWEDVRKGTLVAYVIKKEDTNITNPINRILIKSYVNGNDRKVAIEDRVYFGGGDREIANFKETVEQWLDEKQGAIDKEYALEDGLYPDGRLTVTPDDKLISKLNKIYDNVVAFDDFLYVVTKKGLRGILDKKGIPIIKPIYHSLVLRVADNDNKMYALISNDTGQKGVISFETKRETIPFGQYKKVESPSGCGFVIVTDNEGKIGAAHLDGTLISEIKYEKQSTISQSAFTLKIGNITLLLCKDKSFEITDFDFHHDSGYAMGKMNGKCGIISDKGDIIIPFEYEDAKVLYVDYFGGKQVCISKKGGKYAIHSDDEVTLHIYDNVIYKYGYILVYIGDKVGVDTTNGKMIIPIEYDKDDITFGGSGYIEVKKNGLYSIYRHDSLIMEKLPYNNIKNYTEIGNEYLIISRVSSTHQTVYALVTRHGEVLLKFEDEYVNIQENYQDVNLLTVMKRLSGNIGTSGLYDIAARKMLIPMQYESIVIVEFMFYCKTKGGYHLYTKKGELLFDGEVFTNDGFDRTYQLFVSKSHSIKINKTTGKISNREE